MVSPGDKVRKKANPSRIGMLGKETSGSEKRLQGLVTWLDNNQEEFVLLKTLETVSTTKDGPYELILKGKYGRAKDLRRTITAYRLGGRLSNLIYSLETTNTEFFPYQFKPVLQFLESPTNSLLIADEVGLGKTIEAGLIWTELKARVDARRLLVVCPAMLRLKWKRELDLRFGIKADIVDAGELLETLDQSKNRPYESFALIASYQGLRPPSRISRKTQRNSKTAKLAEFLESSVFDTPLFDLIIFDEAHYLRNSGTKTHELADLLRPVTHGVVMLSATPIQLKSTDLFNLLNILDEKSFPFEYSFDHQIKRNEPLLRLRDKLLAQPIDAEEFEKTLGELSHSGLDHSEQLRYLQTNPPTDEQLSSPRGRSEIADQLDRINPLTKIISRTLKRDVHENRVIRESNLIRAEMNAVEERFYEDVTQAVRLFCSKSEISEGFLLTTPQRQMASCMPAACKRWHIRLEEKLETENDEEEQLYEMGLNGWGEYVLRPFERNDGVLLNELVKIAERAGDYESLRLNDSKYAELLRTLRTYWKKHKQQKIVLFSFFKDTLRYLQERLAEDGIASVILHGNINKDDALQEFENPDGPSILLSSEVASEGVDLQFSSVLINYDLPWNPAKIEQRIGRIDRIGQKESKILIWNFVYADTVDDRVCQRLLVRLNTFRKALGSTEMILGNEIRKLTQDLLTHTLTPAQEEQRIEQTKIALETNALQQAQLENEASKLIAHSEFIQDKVRSAKNLGRHITGDDLYIYTSDYLLAAFPGTRLTEDPKTKKHYRLHLSVDARLQFEEYIGKNYMRGKTNILSSNAPLLQFENRVGNVPYGVERIVQDHPLIRFISYHQTNASQESFYTNVVAAVVSTSKAMLEPGLYVFAVAHWYFSGSRESERLEYCVKNLTDGRTISPESSELLVNLAAAEGTDFLAASNIIDGQIAADLQDECRAELEEAFYTHRDAFRREDNDRIRTMIKVLEDSHEEKRRKLREQIQDAKNSDDPRRIKNIPSLVGRFKTQSESIEKRGEELRFKINKLQAKDMVICSGVIRVN